MQLDCAVDEIKTLLENADGLSDAEIITAFPDRIKPTRLECITVAVGLNEIALAPSELEGSGRAGQLSVFADIYAPSSGKNGALMSTLAGICRALDKYCIVSVKAEKPFYGREVQAIVLKTVITFSDRIAFGGDGIE